MSEKEKRRTTEKTLMCKQFMNMIQDGMSNRELIKIMVLILGVNIERIVTVKRICFLQNKKA